MTDIELDTRDAGKAADLVARAAILFARVSGYIAENHMRESRGEAPLYDSVCFEAAIHEWFPEL